MIFKINSPVIKNTLKYFSCMIEIIEKVAASNLCSHSHQVWQVTTHWAGAELDQSVTYTIMPRIVSFTAWYNSELESVPRVRAQQVDFTIIPWEGNTITQVERYSTWVSAWISGERKWFFVDTELGCESGLLLMGQCTVEHWWPLVPDVTMLPVTWDLWLVSMCQYQSVTFTQYLDFPCI